MGHTHTPAQSEPFPGRRYCNPGAWLDGFRYAVATEQAVELRQFD
jgi:UDP-2,3-diacylglucosamine pyrophosphatase LpxH